MNKLFVVLALAIIILGAIIIGTSEGADQYVTPHNIYKNAERISTHCSGKDTDTKCVIYVLKHDGKIYRAEVDRQLTAIQSAITGITLEQYNEFLTDKMGAMPVKEKK